MTTVLGTPQNGTSFVLGDTEDMKYSQYGAIDTSDKHNQRLSRCTDRGGHEFCSDGVTLSPNPNLNSLRPPAATFVPVESYSQGKVAYGVENQEVAESLRYAVSANGACGLRHATNIRHMSDVQNLVKTEERSADDN